jgi:glycosyltransferase involved in cell wall biosynthesis
MKKQPKVFFDLRQTIIGAKTHFGVSRYGSELVGAFAKIHPVTMIICDERQLNLLPKGIPYVKLNNIMSISELWIAHKLNKLGADVVFNPLQVMGSWGRKYKLILTMQDITYYKHPTPPRNLPPLVRLVWWLSYQAKWPQRLLLSAADHVATVSETSKKEILAMRLTDKPIDVVYNSSNEDHANTRTKKIKKDLVFVGNIAMRYKNAETLIAAMSLLPEYTLHFTSTVAPERKAELLELADNPKQIVFWNGASERDMYKLLASATAAVFASRSEGFGLPLIEAASVGTPIVCSDIAVFHEVGGNAPIYCDPESPEQYAKAIRRIEKDPKLVASMSKKGMEHSKKFSWEASAKQLLGIIKKLTG